VADMAQCPESNFEYCYKDCTDNNRSEKKPYLPEGILGSNTVKLLSDDKDCSKFNPSQFHAVLNFLILCKDAKEEK